MTLRLLALALAVLASACPGRGGPPGSTANTPNDPLVQEAPPSDVPPPTAKLEGGAIVLSEQIDFEAGSDTIAAHSEQVLRALSDLLSERTDITLLRIEGHSDSQGAEEYNQRMSEQRAFAVARWLAGNGIDCKRLIAVGFGETKPVADNRTAEGRAQNRRLELAPAELRGRAIGGMPADGGGAVAGDPCR